MTPAEQDKELREKIATIIEYWDFSPLQDEDGRIERLKNEIMQLITADRERVALEARIDEMKLHRHEWALFGDRPPYKGESVSLPILLAYHNDRIAELTKGEQE